MTRVRGRDQIEVALLVDRLRRDGVWPEEALDRRDDEVDVSHCREKAGGPDVPTADLDAFAQCARFRLEACPPR